ncbi:MAG: cytidylate kinase [Candidatus Omnitrophica bacterium ADurb.Bin277]|nr:MAG: cytidylate kinase [Candidatus Omnitrophica bacterium ADurb.Bin277]
MGEIEKLKSFVDSFQYREKYLAAIDPKNGRYPFITISRDTGAGGHNLADAVMALIDQEKKDPLFQDWQICDQEICSRLARDSRLKVSRESLIVTEYRSATEDVLSQLLTGEASQEKIARRMFAMMRDLAVYGKSIIIGRGATCLTRNLSYGIHIRLVASLPSRISLMMKAHGKDEKWAREKIREQDRAKAAFVKNFFHKDIHDPLLYDAIWNTDRIGIDEIARILVSWIKNKAALPK